jgi:phosphatidylglycerol:prolipoprotein diacylglycerol transferase
MHPLLGPFDPPKFPVGPVTIHLFGILVAMGFWLGGALAMKKAQRFGGSGEAVNRLIGWLVLGTFVGGHLGHVLWYEPETIRQDPAVLLRVWEGLSSFGGFVVCVPLTVWFFRKEKLNFWPNADGLAIGFTLGWFFGRMGCFSAHDHAGNQTEFWLGVYGMCPGNNPTIACHDLGLYEAIWSLGMFGLFTLLDRTPRFRGFYVAVLAIAYAVCRFASDFFRNIAVDARYPEGGLTPAQYGCVLMLVVGALVLRARGSTVAAPFST